MKCVPVSPSLDKFTINEKKLSLNFGILLAENVPRNDQLILFIN